VLDYHYGSLPQTLLPLFLLFCNKFQKRKYARRTCLPLLIFSPSVWIFLVLELRVNLVVQEHEDCEEHLQGDCESLAMLACGLVRARENSDVQTMASKRFSRNIVLQHWLQFIHMLPELLPVWCGIFLAFADLIWFQSNCFGGLVQSFLVTISS